MTLPPPTTLLLRATLQDILDELGLLRVPMLHDSDIRYHLEECSKHLRSLANQLDSVRILYPRVDVVFPDPHEVLRSLS